MVPKKLFFSSFIVIKTPLWSFMAKPVNIIKKFQNFVTEILKKKLNILNLTHVQIPLFT